MGQIQRAVSYLRWFFLSLFLFLLLACSSHPLKKFNPNSLNNLHFQGVFSVVWEEGHQSGHFTWDQNNPHDFMLTLSGPLGLGATQMIEKPTGVTLITSDGKQYHASTPEALLQRVFLWSMPINGMSYWLIGQPLPKLPYTVTYDEKGRLFNLSQSGWLIQYAWVEDQSYPEKIILLRSQARITLVFSQ